MAKEQSPQESTTHRPTKRKGRPVGVALFPRNSLEEAIKVPATIWEKGGGRAMALGDVAEFTKSDAGASYSPTSSTFAELVRSANRYGLIEGSWQQKVSTTISLTELGRSIVAPKASDDVNTALRTALETPEVFREFLESFQGMVIPVEKICINTLIRDHNVRTQDAKACYDVLMKNIEELNLSKSKFLRLDNLSATTGAIISTEEVEGGTTKEQGEEPIGTTQPPAGEQAPLSQQELIKVPRVFISHSKNKKILANIEQMLTFGKFDYRVAEEKETLSIPLSEKVFGLMRECNSAIINLSADQEKKEGETYGLNENVLIEIGGAFLHYDRRVLLVIDKQLKDRLPTILLGITAVFYEGQELTLNDGMKIMSVLDEFRKNI